MPLIDHFRPPLSNHRHWESFLSQWASAIADQLNEQILPDGYFAETQVQVGSRVAVKVATFEETPRIRPRSSAGVAVAEAPAWMPIGAETLLPLNLKASYSLTCRRGRVV